MTKVIFIKHLIRYPFKLFFAAVMAIFLAIITTIALPVIWLTEDDAEATQLFIKHAKEFVGVFNGVFKF